MQKPLVIALAGNPNAGKTTVFNAITGARQHVGNYPGITVERKEGCVTCGDRKLQLVDLPGTYSLTAYSQEEVVAREYLADERPDAVIHVLNASALERNLYLTVQLLELGAPVMLALNVMDEARAHGWIVDSERLSKLLDLPVVETIARTGKGMDELLAAAGTHAQENQNADWKPLTISYGPDLDPVIAEMVDAIEREKFLTDRYPARWTAIKYLERDDAVLEQGRNAGKVAETLEDLARRVAEHCRTTLNMDPEAIIADYRYGFISSILKQGVLSREDRKERILLSDKIDRVLTQRLVGPIIMVAVLFAIYNLTFVLGEVPMGWLESLFGFLHDTAASILPDGLLQSLVVSGVIDGVGGVLGFVPLIMIMFFCISFLEDSGYMARVAYMLDKVFNFFGLHGSSVMPFIISGGIAGGCAVPGVMAARTLRSPKEKIATVLTAPFMTCGAKLPVFILLVGVFFPTHQALALFLVSLAGWTMALVTSKVLRCTVIRGPSTPFVLELPPYRMPTFRGMCIHTWERTWHYIKKAGTVILAVSILLWALMTFPSLPQDQVAQFETMAETAQTQALAEAQAQNLSTEETDALVTSSLDDVANQEAEAALLHSYAGRIGTALEPVTSWAGFDWRLNIALVGGFAAKEVVISTLGTSYSLGEVDPEDSGSLAERIESNPNFTMATAVALMAFVLIYAPCFVTVVTIAKETNWKWAIFSTAYSTIIGFVLAVVLYQGLSVT
ncbi:ferrous iron transport protein B [Oceanidesulfovibrio marinus]|uniref:Ferrous iron transport protein B n=1 Tax=Oceanidesulfovibrio marinus TaxID=370038 RepID=A0A6P1ZFE3_9BACT|nr:ferrous iron transport protein B [Oceanidesulfovibrio marinus]TVM31053.1 ferrous iron transport protein B [Oceanidesulfovibrio marinus]